MGWLQIGLLVYAAVVTFVAGLALVWLRDAEDELHMLQSSNSYQLSTLSNLREELFAHKAMEKRLLNTPVAGSYFASLKETHTHYQPDSQRADLPAGLRAKAKVKAKTYGGYFGGSRTS